MKTSLLPIIAGILDIIGGAIGIFSGHFADSMDYPDTTAATLLFCMATLALGGGIFAIKKRMWLLALFGSIVSFLLLAFLLQALPVFWGLQGIRTHPTVTLLLFIGAFLGMVCIALTAFSKKEFK